MRGRLSPAAGMTAAALAIGLILRLIGLQFGLPAVYNPDEVSIMARALSFAKGTLNPHNFLYPTLYFYVLFVWVGVYLAFVRLTGGVSSLPALQRLYFTAPTGIYTAGRALGAASGSATIFLVHRLGSRLLDARAGAAAAVFLAVAPLAVRDAHYVKHDVFATMTVVVAYLAMARLWPAPRPVGPSRRDVVLAGAACGAAFSTHYYCVFLGLPLVWVIIQAGRHPVMGPAEPGRYGAAVVSGFSRTTLVTLTIAGLAAGAAFLLCSPFIAVEPLTAWRDITANRQIVIDRAVEAGAFAPAARYLEMLWSDSIGAPIVALGAAGAVGMLVAAPARAVFLLAFPIPFFLFITNTFPATRYLNPLLPFVALFAASVLSWLVARTRAPGWVFWTTVIACAAPGLVDSLQTDLFFRRSDTRTLALGYIERQIPSGATVLVQPYSVPMTPSREGLVEALARNLGNAESASTKFQIQLSLDPYPSPAYRLIYLGHGGLDADKIYVDYNELGGPRGLDALRRLDVAFVVLKRYNTSDPETTPFLAALAQEGRRVAVFSPYRSGLSETEQARIDPFLHNTDARIDDRLDRPGPPIEIWALGR